MISDVVGTAEVCSLEVHGYSTHLELLPWYQVSCVHSMHQQNHLMTLVVTRETQNNLVVKFIMSISSLTSICTKTLFTRWFIFADWPLATFSQSCGFGMMCSARQGNNQYCARHCCTVTTSENSVPRSTQTYCHNPNNGWVAAWGCGRWPRVSLTIFLLNPSTAVRWVTPNMGRFSLWSRSTLCAKKLSCVRWRVEISTSPLSPTSLSYRRKPTHWTTNTIVSIWKTFFSYVNAHLSSLLLKAPSVPYFANDFCVIDVHSHLHCYICCDYACMSVSISFHVVFKGGMHTAISASGNHHVLLETWKALKCKLLVQLHCMLQHCCHSIGLQSSVLHVVWSVHVHMCTSLVHACAYIGPLSH